MSGKRFNGILKLERFFFGEVIQGYDKLSTITQIEQKNTCVR